MMSIELTDHQRQAIRADSGRPIEVIDPATNEHYVLLARDQYERVKTLVESTPSDCDGIVPPGILRSQQAFWRDLPELLRNKRNRGKWVCYHCDERVGIAKSDEPLIRECIRRRIPENAYHLDVIAPHALPPWEPEEIEGGGHEVDEDIDEDFPITGESA